MSHIRQFVSRTHFISNRTNPLLNRVSQSIRPRIGYGSSLITRSLSTTSLQVDYNNPTIQLLEENPNLNYRLYYQHGLPTDAHKAEFDAFNDQIWYGREGHEMVFKLKEMSKDIKSCDIFLMRDYHNDKIIGCNSIKRCSSTLDTILNTDKYGTDNFNYTIRRNTAIAPDMQGKGYGKVIRQYSKHLDDLHTDKHGLSMTDVQIKNVASLQLQLKSGFEITGQCNIYFHYRSNPEKMVESVAGKYDMHKMDANGAEWEALNNLHSDMMKKYGIIDLSVTSNKIHVDAESPVYVVKPYNSDNILAAFQVNPMLVQLKAPNKAIKYAMDYGSKLLNGMDGTEKDFRTMYLSPIYIDYDNREYDIVDAVGSLISYMLGQHGRHFGTSIGHTKHPYVDFVEKNKNEVLGRVGAMMSDKEAMNIIMKFSGLNDEKMNMIKNNPLTVKLPQMLCG